MDAAIRVNENQKTRLLKKAKEKLMTFCGVHAAVLGVAFKPGTDDLREAPAIDNIRQLLKEGASIKVYDPAAGNQFREFCKSEGDANGRLSLVSGWKEALLEADVCFIFTEWPEFQEIAPKMFAEYMRNPMVLDGRNIYDRRKMEEAGVEYEGIGS